MRLTRKLIRSRALAQPEKYAVTYDGEITHIWTKDEDPVGVTMWENGIVTRADVPLHMASAMVMRDVAKTLGMDFSA